jgi:hypothetical protein
MPYLRSYVGTDWYMKGLQQYVVILEKNTTLYKTSIKIIDETKLEIKSKFVFLVIYNMIKD